ATRQALTAGLQKGIAYLKANQKPDGSWEFHEGITGLAALAVLNQPGSTTRIDPAADKAIKFMLGLVKPDGSIFSKDMAAVNTAIAMMALLETKNPAYDATIKKAQQYLVNAQFDGGEGV